MLGFFYTKWYTIPMNKKGFTVLELLIVMGIIAILLAVMLASLSVSRERARDNIRIAGVNNLVLALEQYRAICRNYPAKVNNLEASQFCSTRDEGLALGLLLPETPALPLEEEYFYSAFANSSSTEKCTNYHIGVVLERKNDDMLNTDSDREKSNINLCRDSGDDFEDADIEREDDLLYDLYR